MIHLVSPGGGLIDRALQSVLTSYGYNWTSISMSSLRGWEIDSLMDNSTTELILTDCHHVSAFKYFIQFPKNIRLKVHWWQILTPSVQHFENVATTLTAIRDALQQVNYTFTFLFDSQYDGVVWKSVLAKIPPHSLQELAGLGKLLFLPNVELSQFYYQVSPRRRERLSLIFPRTNRPTAIQAARAIELILDRADLHPNQSKSTIHSFSR